jgi:hypothetical protein
MRLIVGLPVRLGRKDATLVEISRGGARVRHSGLMKVDTDLIMSFMSGADQFSAHARVLSSRVVGLGTGEGGATLFETVVRFTHTPAESLATIEMMLGSEQPPVTA